MKQIVQSNCLAGHLEIAVAVSCPAWLEALPSAVDICRRAAAAAWAAIPRIVPGVNPEAIPQEGVVEVSLVLADDAFVRRLNRDYRDRDEPTNVLSFAHQDKGGPARPEGGPLILGDVIVALETTTREARRDGKSLADHLSHLVTHGALHLAGYDHQTDTDAECMEKLEIEILSALGIANPYAVEAVFHQAAFHRTGVE